MGIVGSGTGAVPLLGAYKPLKWRTDQLWPEVGPRQVLGPHGGVYEPVCHSRDMYTTEHKRTCSAVVEVPNSTLLPTVPTMLACVNVEVRPVCVR